MMLDLLIAAQAVSETREVQGQPDGILAFTLDYPDPPHLVTERAKLAALLGGDRFVLEAYEPDPNILELSFPDVPRQQSPSFLYRTAQDLTDALGLRQCEPDIGAPWHDTLSVPEAPEGFLGDLAWALCQSGKPTPVDNGWAPKLIRAVEVHARGIRGSGVRIGQPDTGAATHVELGEGVAFDDGFDFFTNRRGGRDPLSPDMPSPGHGTGTSSVVVSRSSGIVTGSAPGATLIPLRCINGVVIGSGTRVAAAIDRARAQGCDIVTMSLGGPTLGNKLRRAIERAVAADMIVLAAAGNCVGQVVQPARFPPVIAVAGTNEFDLPWKGSSRGGQVDVSAPGENVSVAKREPLEPGAPADPTAESRVNLRGQGTSFAVALTAGVAALWIEHHGKAAIREEARRRGIPVQELFRSALRQTARRPESWEGGQMGAGVVDAVRLVDLSLKQIGGPTPTEGTSSGVFDVADLPERFRPEAEFLNFDYALRRDAERAGALENAVTPQPSPQLAAAAARACAPALPAPANIVTPKAPPADLTESVRKLGAARSSGLESAGGISLERARERLRAPDAIDELMETVDAAFAERKSLAGDRINDDAQKQAARLIHEAVKRERAEDLAGVGTPGHRASLEALVRLTGRPAFRVPRDRKTLLAMKLGQWSALLKPREALWRPLTDAVGRIDHRFHSDEPWSHVGTGFVIGPGRVLTNRHVLDALAEPMPAPPGEARFEMFGEASIVFDDDAADEATRFAITAPITAGRDRIGRFVDLSKVDAAVLGIEKENGIGRHPAPIRPVKLSTTSGAIAEMLVAGYPGRPGEGAEPADASQIGTFWTRIDEIFGDEYGVKYMAPGLVMDQPGALAGDVFGRVFSHDATTLGGFSGGGIVPLTGDGGFCGLHFGGATLSQNLAHDIGTLLARSDGAFDPAHV
jgi:hypothetical protein